MNDHPASEGPSVLCLEGDDATVERIRADDEWGDVDLRVVGDAAAALDALAGADVDVLVLEPADLDWDPAQFLTAVEEADPSVPVAVYTRLETETLDEDLLSRVSTVVEKGAVLESLGFLREKLRSYETGRSPPEALEDYRTLVEAARDAIYVLDADGRLRYCNESMADLLGYERAELVGEHASKTMEAGELERGQAVIQEMMAEGKRESSVVDMTLRTADGDPVRLGINFTLLYDDGAYAGLVGVARDVTERRRRERRLERQNERLEEFATLVSHDLRNPVERARGGLELARTECDSDHLDHVDAALDRMETIIDDTLTLARQGQTVGETEPVDLEALAERCWIGGEDAELVSEGDLRVTADPDRLENVLSNLFRNAVEHGGEEVTVRLGRLPDGFYVEDDGPGIPGDDREAMFEVGTTTADDGTGFGLAIVRRIVEAHGWDVGLAESEAGGLRVEITGVEFLDG